MATWYRIPKWEFHKRAGGGAGTGAGKNGVLAGVLAQVLAGRALWENRDQTVLHQVAGISMQGSGLDIFDLFDVFGVPGP